MLLKFALSLNTLRLRSILNIYLTALVFSGIIMSGCGSYQQDIMFKPNKDMEAEQLSQVISEAEKNYIIQVNDLLNLNVFTNKGERIIDPNFELGVGQGGNQQMQRQQRDFDYLVQIDGMVKLPILDRVKLEGLTIQQAETLLEQRYNEYYKDSYVKLIYNNKRVIVLGANGGEVVPLPNENMSLIEVIALAGGIDQTGKAHNIRLVRGDLSNPSVYMVDLGTIGGMKASILNVEPGDIIYIEPRRRVFFEALSDVTPILSLVTSLVTLAFVLANL